MDSIQPLEVRRLFTSVSGQVTIADSHDFNNVHPIVLPGYKVYLDRNSNGRLDSSERFTRSDEKGNYRFEDVAAGDYTLRIVSVADGEKWTNEGGDAVPLKLDAG